MVFNWQTLLKTSAHKPYMQLDFSLRTTKRSIGHLRFSVPYKINQSCIDTILYFPYACMQLSS